jgi:hypothetical protein
MLVLYMLKGRIRERNRVCGVLFMYLEGGFAFPLQRHLPSDILGNVKSEPEGHGGPALKMAQCFGP